MVAVFLLLSFVSADPVADESRGTMVDKVLQYYDLPPTQALKFKSYVLRSHVMAQTTSAPTLRPVSQAQCVDEVLNHGLLQSDPEDEKICGSKNMVPIPEKDEPKSSASVCIDQYEFPNIPCEYPLVWVNSLDAVEICSAVGKRICDAHEWEGGCTGQEEPEDYLFNLPDLQLRRQAHNSKRKITWAYGTVRDRDLCAFGSQKSEDCDQALVTGKGVYSTCGANTYPTGYFYQCKSSLGVYDQHGNVSELMNMPDQPDHLASKGGLGVTEMRGSWFVFNKFKYPQPHEDDCRWRAPGWHRTSMTDPRGTSNYMMGFRCCKNIK